MISARAVTNENGTMWSQRDYKSDIASGETSSGKQYAWHPIHIKDKIHLCLGDITDLNRWSCLALFIMRHNVEYNYLTPCEIYCSSNSAKRMDVGDYSYIEHHKTVHRCKKKHDTIAQ